jgi:hypothetical protein
MLLRLLDTTERAPGGHARLVRRHATTLELVLDRRQMRLDLAGQFPLGARRTHGVDDTQKKPSKAPHRECTH